MLNESMFIRRMLEAGVSGYLFKTVDKTELVRVIHKVAAGETHFGEEVTQQLVSGFSKTTSSPLDVLTKREKEILKLIAQGLTDKEIAEKVAENMQKIYNEIGIENFVYVSKINDQGIRIV